MEEFFFGCLGMLIMLIVVIIVSPILRGTVNSMAYETLPCMESI